MITILVYYWPLLIAALLIGVASGVLAYRSPGSKRRK